MKTKNFLAKMESLKEMFDFLKGFCTSQNLSPTLTDQVILAGEEALVNIIKYSYPQDADGLISITCEQAGTSGIKITIKDQGIHFNPLENLPLNQSNDTLGGYGIHLLKGLMDVIDYKRVENENILTLIKYYSL